MQTDRGVTADATFRVNEREKIFINFHHWLSVHFIAASPVAFASETGLQAARRNRNRPDSPITTLSVGLFWFSPGPQDVSHRDVDKLEVVQAAISMMLTWCLKLCQNNNLIVKELHFSFKVTWTTVAASPGKTVVQNRGPLGRFAFDLERAKDHLHRL